MILKQCAQLRLPVPKKIAEAPTLLPGLSVYLQAFFDLATCRSLGWSEGPIPWTAIDRYAVANGFGDEQRDDVFFHVRRLDEAFLSWRRKKDDKEKSRGGPPKIRKEHQTSGSGG